MNKLSAKISFFCFVGISGFSLGTAHTLVIKSDGSMWGAGSNAYGQLGIDLDRHPFRTNFAQIMPAGPAGGAKAVTAGGWHSVVTKENGSVWSTGGNEFGQLGDGSQTGKERLVRVMPGNAVSSAASAKHSIVLMRDGSVWATGSNRYGQLGDGSTDSKDKLTQCIDDGVQAVAAGSEHSMVLKEDGSVWSAGSNGKGQLGFGSEDGSS